MPRIVYHILDRVVYHSPGACELICTNHIISSRRDHDIPLLLGDFNNLNDTQLRSYPLKQVVRMATRSSAIL